MNITGERQLPVSAKLLWQELLNPEALRSCIPGCETVEKIDDNNFAAVVVIKVGPIKARFSGTVTLSDLLPYEFCQLAGEGKGGIGGFAKGNAVFRLSDLKNETSSLFYDANIQIGGKIASLGDRMFFSVVSKNVHEFFNNLSLLLSSSQLRD